MRILVTGGSGFIGTNLIAHLLSKKVAVLNLDWKAPYISDHASVWAECDIMDKEKVISLTKEFKPDVVIHLAARTDTDIYDLEGDLTEYIQNTEGTAHVVEAIRQTSGIRHFIHTSSMFVCKPGYMPVHDEDFSPYTLYGVSKKVSEAIVRKAELPCLYTIIRPQTIWGPWSMRYKKTLFKVMRSGLYFHPVKKDVRRAYGFVGNVIWQIERILEEGSQVDRKVLYVGDTEINLLEWVQEVSRQLLGKDVRMLPTWMVKGIAVGGDVLRKFSIPFPITSTRYNSMVQDYLTPIQQTHDLLGEAPYSMKQGITHFIEWYNRELETENEVSAAKAQQALASS